MGVPSTATKRTIGTAAGEVGIWYWKTNAGRYLAAFEGQPLKAATRGGVDRAWDAVKAAGRAAREHYGMPVRRTSRATRFAVLRRDGFACRYCGRRPPEVILEVDHLVPVVDGGSSDEDNLITACRDCNKGKGAL